MIHQTRFVTWAGLVAILGFGPVVAASESIPQVGQQAPDFTLPSQDGSPVSLTDFRGRWIVLYFYPKDGTRGCTIEAHNFQRDLPKYEQNHAVIFGVSSANSWSATGRGARERAPLTLSISLDNSPMRFEPAQPLAINTSRTDRLHTKQIL